jgi:hypothetical protein
MGQGKEKQEDALLIVVLVPGLARPHVMQLRLECTGRDPNERQHAQGRVLQHG